MTAALAFLVIPGHLHPDPHRATAEAGRSAAFDSRQVILDGTEYGALR
jgi:hypothetical protein